MGIAAPATTADDQPLAPAPEAEPEPGCPLCGGVLADYSPQVNGRRVCATCAAQLQRELTAEQAVTPRGMVIAGAAGLAGALVGAAVWAGIAIAAGVAVGFVAVLVGYLAGTGVKLGAVKARALRLQVMAGILAVVGLIAAKYFIYAHAIVEYAETQGVTLGWFDGKVLALFPEVLGKMLSPFDLLWVFLAISAAYRVPAPARVSIT